MNNYKLLCDDLYVDMFVNTQLPLPSERGTLLLFFEQISKRYSNMGNFYREDESFYLDEKKGDFYRWACIENDRVGSGVVNPESMEDIYELDSLVLSLVPNILHVTYLDVKTLDYTINLNFDFDGNQDEVIADALFNSSGFGSLIEDNYSKTIIFSPSIVVGLTEDSRTQARISIESGTSLLNPNKWCREDKDYINLSCTIRRYPKINERMDLVKSFAEQFRIMDEIMDEKIIPGIIQPLAETITEKRII